MTVQEYRKKIGATTKVKAPNKHSESKLQQTCIKEFRLKFKPPQFFIFAIPNGGVRKGGKTVGVNNVPLEAVIMKREGVVSGVSDLFVMSPYRSKSKGLFLECKTTTKQSDNQIEFEKICIEMGYNYAVFTSRNEFFKIINDFFNDKNG